MSAIPTSRCGLERRGKGIYRGRPRRGVIVDYVKVDEWVDNDGVGHHPAWGWEAWRIHRNGRTWIGEGVTRTLGLARWFAAGVMPP